MGKVVRFLALLLACSLSALALPTPAFGILIAETANTAYDVTVVYDGSQNSSSAYEDAARPPTADEKHVSGAARTFLSQIADLPAAETTGVRGIPRITESDLTRVEAHLDDVLVNQFSDLPRSTALQFQAGERSMLQRLQGGATTSQDIEFYMHELKESAGFRATGNLMDAHNAALDWRGVTSKDLFHPGVIYGEDQREFEGGRPSL